MHKLLLILLLTLLPTAAFSTTNYDPGVNGNIGGFQGTGDTAYTPTLSAGFGTPTNVNFQYRRDGDQLIVHGTFTAGTVAASLGTISLPSGLSIDTTKLLAASTAGPCPAVGFYSTNDANQHGHILACTSTSTTIVYNSLNMVNDGHLTPNNANGSFTSSHVASITFTVPISGWSAGGAGAVPTNSVISGSSNGARLETAVIGGTAANNNCTTTNCALFNSSGGITGVTWDAAGRFHITLSSTSCASAWHCVANSWDYVGGQPVDCRRYDAGTGGAPSTTNYTFRCQTPSAGTDTNVAADIMCSCSK